MTSQQNSVLRLLTSVSGNFTNSESDRLSHMKKKVVIRLRTLCYLEFINIFLLPVAFILYYKVDYQSLGINLIVSILLSSFLLFQGSLLWFAKIRELTNKNFILIRLFKTFKYLNIFCFAVLFILILRVPFVGKNDIIGTAFFSTLAVLEYINYYEVQLMYDTRNDLKYLFRFGRLKRSKLKTMLSGPVTT